MRLLAALLVATVPAAAGPYIAPDAARWSTTPSTCARRSASPDPIPTWSRVQWSLSLGMGSTYTDRWRATAAVVPQASYAVWVKEWVCQPGSGLFTDHRWRRASLAISGDLRWDLESGDLELRPALRLSRSHMASGFLAVGTSWVPSSELFIAAGPLFDRRWSGASLSFGGRATILAVELRASIRPESRGQEVMVLVGLTDLHGLWNLGADRATHRPEP